MHSAGDVPRSRGAADRAIDRELGSLTQRVTFQRRPSVAPNGVLLVSSTSTDGRRRIRYKQRDGSGC